MAARWITALVEPPTASMTRSALVKAAGVRMRSGLQPLCRQRHGTRAGLAGVAHPVGEHRRDRGATPGSIMPSASAAQAMVLAVPITMQVPADGMSRPPTSAISSSSTRPPRWAPQ